MALTSFLLTCSTNASVKAIEDLQSLSSRPDDWSIVLLVFGLSPAHCQISVMVYQKQDFYLS